MPGNNFSGTSTTRSLYLQETWTPIPALSVTATARYNRTRVSSELLTRATAGQVALHELREFRAPEYTDGQVFRRTKSQESFTYRSFNPSFGINWRPEPGIEPVRQPQPRGADTVGGRTRLCLRPHARAAGAGLARPRHRTAQPHRAGVQPADQPVVGPLPAADPGDLG